jgi:hypothetical protein
MIYSTIFDGSSVVRLMVRKCHRNGSLYPWMLSRNIEQLESGLRIVSHGSEFLPVTVHIVHQNPCRRISQRSNYRHSINNKKRVVGVI